VKLILDVEGAVMSGEQRFSEVFVLVVEVGLTHDAAPLHKHAGCWECQIDDHWRVSVNGHPEPRKNSRGCEVQPSATLVEYLGIPVGTIHPFGGMMCEGSCNGAPAEEALVAALRSHLTAVRAQRAPVAVLAHAEPDPHEIHRFADDGNPHHEIGGEG
jgi:hypothetical protein